MGQRGSVAIERVSGQEWAGKGTALIDFFFSFGALELFFESGNFMEAYWILGLLCLLFGALISNKIRPELVFVGAVTICMAAGWIAPKNLLLHYSNETLVGLILLMQVSSVLEKTHILPWLSKKMIRAGSLHASLSRLSVVSILLSAVLNNTAVVASFMGMIRQNSHFAPSRLLIPLSYAAIMGGMITLIGTSTNLIVNSFVIEAGLPSLGFFDVAYVGLPLAVVGTLYLVLVSPKLLPAHVEKVQTQQRDFFLEADVVAGSKLVGKSVAENGFRKMDSLFLAEIVRNDRLISPVTPEELIEAGDSLVFTGDVAQIHELVKYDGLELHSGTAGILRSNLQEVVIKHNAPIIGSQVKEAQFRTKFDAVIVAVRRGEKRLLGKIGDMVLQPGDSLVLAVGTEFEKHENLRRNFIFLSEVELDDTLAVTKGWQAVGLFVGAIACAALGWCSLFQAMLAVLLLFMALGFLKIKHLKNNLNLGLLLMIGSSLGLAAVMSTYGVDTLLSEGILSITGMESPFWALVGIYLSTVIVTELVTNNAAAALMFPIAYATSQSLEVSYMPFVLAIAFGASASFLTPIGYQTNLMVFSVGKYRFTDFFKIGLGLSLLYGVVVLWLLPYFFPF